jgi:hypothetical protein
MDGQSGMWKLNSRFSQLVYEHALECIVTMEILQMFECYSQKELGVPSNGVLTEQTLTAWMGSAVVQTVAAVREISNS